MLRHGSKSPLFAFSHVNKKSTKSTLFKKHDILSIFNLYPYFCLIEMYKVLKFRTPYCVFELFQCIPNQTGRNLTLKIPAHILRCQKQTFVYQTTLLWNKMHKNLLKPVKVIIHSSHTSKLNLLDSDCIFLDFSTKVTAFKSGLKKYLFQKQSNGGRFDWSINNYESNG